MLIRKLLSRYVDFLSPAIVEQAPAGAGESATGAATGDEGGDAGPSGTVEGDGSEGHSSEGDSKSGEGATGEGDAEETVVMIGDEELPAAVAAPSWVRDLRQKFRDQSRELAQLRAGSAPEPIGSLPPAPGAKPKIDDFEYDAEKFAAALDKWHEASRKRAEAEGKARDNQAQEQRTWEQTVAAYQGAGKALSFADFDDCEAAATSALSTTQQAIIVQGADSAEKAALIMYALGRNMKLLEGLAKVADPVKFAFAVADIQRKLVMTKRKPGTRPESTLPSSSASAAAALSGEDKKLDSLREEAARTGDMTKLIAYRRQKTDAQRRKSA